MSAASWRVGHDGVPWQVDLHLPAVDAPGCDAMSGYACTRAKGHGGRHAATGAAGYVFAVWSDDD